MIMPKLNERGIAHIFIIIILLLGLGLGIYLVTQKTAFFSRASSNPISGPVSGPVNPYVNSDTQAYVGGTLSVNWDASRAGGANRYDWIGLFNQSTGQRLDWFWNNTCAYGDAGANAQATGTCTINIPGGTPTGNYQIRLYNGDTLITTSNVTISTGTQASVTSPAQINPGQELTISWNSNRSTEAVSPKEWVGIFNKSTNQRIDWFWTNTCGYGDSGPNALAIGTCHINLPESTPVGDYEIRLFNVDKQIASADLNVFNGKVVILPAPPGSLTPQGEAIIGVEIVSLNTNYSSTSNLVNGKVSGTIYGLEANKNYDIWFVSASKNDLTPVGTSITTNSQGIAKFSNVSWNATYRRSDPIAYIEIAYPFQPGVTPPTNCSQYNPCLIGNYRIP